MKFIGRGRIKIGVRDEDGNVSAFKFLGCADNFDVTVAVEKTEHFSKCTSAEALDFSQDTRKTTEFSMTLTEWVKQVLLLATRGTEVPDASSGSVSAEACGSDFEANDEYLLGGATGHPHTNVSAVTLADTGGALTLGTDYTLDADTGTIKFLLATNGATTANYTYDDLPYVSFLTAPARDYWIRFDGVNKADSDRKIVVDFYRAQFNPASSLGFLTDDIAPLELTGACLTDDTKDDDDEFGQFGRMSLLES